MDGQQRTISLCRYAAGDFAWGELEINARYFAKQPSDIKERFLDYELTIYVCEGNESEKLDWFQVINIAGLKLTNQEMRNAVYSGPWVTDAKRYFSRRTAPAARLGGKYLSGDMDRQAYLERAICWLIGSEKDIAIRQYMALHQGDEEAVELWLHFQKVIGWVETMFPKYRKEMKGLNWGALYAKYSDRTYNPRTLDGEVAKLMADREVESKRGIYEFLLSGRRDFHLLNLRQFDEEDKRTVYEQQKGVCPCCLESFSFEEMEGDHIKPWSKGGKTRIENLQMLCRECNARKSDKF